MKRTTLMLPESLRTRAMREAARQGISLGELVRNSLERVLKPESLSPSKDPFLSDNKLWKGSTPKDLSQNHDDYLYGKNS